METDSEVSKNKFFSTSSQMTYFTKQKEMNFTFFRPMEEWGKGTAFVADINGYFTQSAYRNSSTYYS